MSLYFLLMILALTWLHGVSYADNSPPNAKPSCVNDCLEDYYFHSNGTANCAANDNFCVCKDPMFPHIVSCCMMGECNNTDIQLGNNWLEWACGIYHINLPPMSTCVPLPNTATSASATTLSSSMAGITSSSQTSVSATSTSSSASQTASTTSTAISSKSSASLASQTSSAAPAASSTNSNKNGGPNTFAIGLGVGLGVGVPLSIAAIGMVAYFFWKTKRDNKHNSGPPSPPPSASLPQNPAGELYSAGSFTRTPAATTSSDFDKRWHPMWASDMGPPPRRPMGPREPHVPELAS